MARKKTGQLTNLKDRTKEERSEIARKGNKAAQEVKRRKKELSIKEMTMRDFVRSFMNKTTSSQQKAVLKQLGFMDEECINMNSFVAMLYAKAMKGDVRAADLLVTLGGYTGDEIRKDSEEARKKLESEARIRMMEAESSQMNITSDDGDDGSVVIYLPKIEEENEEDNGDTGEEKNEV